MGAVFSFLFGLYVVGVFAYWPVAWYTKTERGDVPINRRLKALGLALTWPYLLFVAIQGRQVAVAAESNRRDAEQRILGGTASAETPSPFDAPQRPTNPFDK